MGRTFAEKFEEALEEKRRETPGWGLRTLARELADDDPDRAEVIRRRLNKYRPKPGSGGAAEVRPTEPTRREIENALGLETDSLAPDPDALAAHVDSERDFLNDLAPLRRLWDLEQRLRSGEYELVPAKQDNPER